MVWLIFDSSSSGTGANEGPTEVTDSIKAEASQPELNPPGTVETGSSTPVETTGSDHDLPEQKRRRIERLVTTHNNAESISEITPPKGGLQSSMSSVAHREPTQGIPVSSEPHIGATQMWNLQTGDSLQSVCGESFGNAIGLIASEEQAQAPVFPPILYLPTGKEEPFQ